jgi:DNA gyrase subunit A
MVRMAQDWSLRYTLVDGQGNFGSIDGDSPAQCVTPKQGFGELLKKLLADINKDTG